MNIHLVDGTYELFRAYYGAPGRSGLDGAEVGAVRALCASLLALITREGATHIAVAFDHVIESFRNQLFAGYKTGEGIDPALFEQFPLAEEATQALGFRCWPMVDLEADDALASGAARWADAKEVEQVRICSPDKDLMQCVRSTRVVCVDRRRKVTYDQSGVEAKLGVAPDSIPDYLALVGDSADGIPGIPRWGAKSAATVLRKFRHLEDIPDDPEAWGTPVRGRVALATSLSQHREEALLYRTLATLRTDAPLAESLEDLEWQGASRERVEALSDRLQDPSLKERIPRWTD